MASTKTGRQRAADDPFWATGITKMSAAGQRLARGINDLIARSPALAGLWLGSGWRTGSAEHSSGRALDVIGTADTGRAPTAAERAAMRALADWLIANHKAIGLQWVLLAIDDKVTWSWNADRGTWKQLADRGSISANHRDHLHVYIKSGGAGWADALDKLTVGSGSTSTGSGSTTTSTWDGKTFPGAAAFKTGKKHAAVKVVQQRLVAHGYDPGTVNSYWGPKSAAATKRFQQAQGWAGSNADGIPGAVTWERLLAAPKPKPTAPAATRYRVATKSGRLNGRSGPGTKYPITMTAAKGTILNIVETKNGWGRSTGDHWYSLSYLQKA